MSVAVFDLQDCNEFWILHRLDRIQKYTVDVDPQCDVAK